VILISKEKKRGVTYINEDKRGNEPEQLNMKEGIMERRSTKDQRNRENRER